ncbi:MAG: CvpA family protein [Burkholderiaceae bacterium]|jgi:membrane protein required for colicin V production|nr:CvpA family protein [Burkholderiaceae bacterium]
MQWFEALTWIDLVVIGVVLLSTLLSLFRGLIKEIASLAVWVLAFVGASRLASPAAEFVPDWIAPAFQQTVAFVVILLVILLLGRLLTMLLKEMVSAAGISGLDRLLGMGFGLARGGLLVTVLAILAAMTALPTQPAWRSAQTRPFLELGIRTAAPWLPPPVGDRLRLPVSSSSGSGSLGSSACAV